MPGTPIKNKMLADIAAMGGDETILARIAAGDTITKIATELGISRPFLSGHLNRNAQAKAALADAKTNRADAYADEALRLADDVAADPNQINKARQQIDVRKWLAGIDAPEKYGPKQAGVTVNIGSLHLDALRKVTTEIGHPDVIEGTAEDVTDV